MKSQSEKHKQSVRCIRKQLPDYFLPSSTDQVVVGRDGVLTSKPTRVLAGVNPAVVRVGEEADVELAARGHDRGKVVLTAACGVPAKVVAGVCANERSLLIGAIVQRNVVTTPRVGAGHAARFLARAFEVHLCNHKQSESSDTSLETNCEGIACVYLRVNVKRTNSPAGAWIVV